MSILKVLKSLAPKFNGGPLVKSGPTRGKVRARTKSGTWRRKRSDFGIKRKR